MENLFGQMEKNIMVNLKTTQFMVKEHTLGQMVINILGIGSIIENKVKDSLSLLMVISIKANFKVEIHQVMAHLNIKMAIYFLGKL